MWDVVCCGCGMVRRAGLRWLGMCIPGCAARVLTCGAVVVRVGGVVVIFVGGGVVVVGDVVVDGVRD